jgi:hypothetical protein
MSQATDLSKENPMKSSLPLLALAVVLGSSVFGALSAAPIAAPIAALIDGPQAAVAAPAAQPVHLADNDGDDDDEGGFFSHLFGHHEHHDRRGHDDDDHDNRACPAGSTACAQGTTPAAAGTTAPPANGLFTPGAKPQVQTN